MSDHPESAVKFDAWHDGIEIHCACDMFPMMSEVERDRADQNKSGLTARTVSIGNARAALSDRGDDVYESPPSAVAALIRVEALPEHIWEPCCGSGLIVEALRASGYRVSASDLVGDRIDFLMEWLAPEGVGAIVTNPPYKLAADFVRMDSSSCRK